MFVAVADDSAELFALLSVDGVSLRDSTQHVVSTATQAAWARACRLMFCTRHVLTASKFGSRPLSNS